MLALMFSVAALERYCTYHLRRDRNALAASAVLAAAAIFTKQTFMAAGATICVRLPLLEYRFGLHQRQRQEWSQDRVAPALGALAARLRLETDDKARAEAESAVRSRVG